MPFVLNSGQSALTSSGSQGSALLSALFLMTLVAIAATAMSTRLQMDIYRTRLSIQSDRILLASQAVEFWSMSSIINPDIKLKPLNDDGEVCRFPVKFKKYYPELLITGSIYDLQSRFNINNLINKAYKPIFLRLLEDTLQKIPLDKLEYIVKSTANWVNPFDPGTGIDELMNFYFDQDPSYTPGFQPMQSISEFRMVAGVNAAIFKALKPFVTALPPMTPVNLNTASVQVIRTLGEGLSNEKANEFLALRSSKGEFSVRDILLLVGQFKLPADQICVESTYYLSVGHVKSADLALTLYAVLQRTKDRHGVWSVRVLSETLNAD